MKLEPFAESRRCDSASNLCKAKSFLIFAYSVRSSSSTGRGDLEDWGVEMSIGGLELCESISLLLPLGDWLVNLP